MTYPMCPTCGHNTSALLAEHCTAFVRYPDGDPRGLAGYCNHQCTTDPAVRRWLASRTEDAEEAP